MQFTTVKTIQFNKSDINTEILDLMEYFLQFKDNTSMGEKIFFGDVFEQIEDDGLTAEAVNQLNILITLSREFEYVHLIGE